MKDPLAPRPMTPDEIADLVQRAQASGKRIAIARGRANGRLSGRPNIERVCGVITAVGDARVTVVFQVLKCNGSPPQPLDGDIELDVPFDDLPRRDRRYAVVGAFVDWLPKEARLLVWRESWTDVEIAAIAEACADLDESFC